MSQTTAPPLPQLAHAAPRIDSLDLLRGIAILGIFLMNTWTMSLPQDTYTNPATYNPNWVPGSGFPVFNLDSGTVSYTTLQPLTGLNHWVYVVIHLFADMKFITTFSMLFGAGIVLQADRSRKKGHNPWTTHYLRMSVLLMFGLIHTFGFWYGDILTDYALAGLILAPLRLLPAWILCLAGIFMVATPTGLEIAHVHHRNALSSAQTAEEIQAINTGPYRYIDRLNRLESDLYNRSGQAFDDRMIELGHTNPDAEFPNENDRELATYRADWWTQVVGHRFWCSIIDHTTGFATWTFWRCGGCFLIGMSLQKRRFFHAAWPLSAYATIASFTIPVGWLLTYLGVLFNQRVGWVESEDFLSVWHLGQQFNYWGSLLCSFGYMSVGVLLAAQCAKPGSLLNKALIPIRSIGRMALTCYLTETLIGTTFYYGHGFAMFGRTTRFDNLYMMVFPTWIFLMFFATLWLTIFRQGPLEWFWHSIVYWDWKNPLKSAAGPDASLSPSVAGTAGDS